MDSKEITCWGAGFYGQTSNNGNNLPTKVTFEEKVLDLQLGCFGGNPSGQVGVGHTNNVFVEPKNVCAAGIFAASALADCL